jgi:glycosyltransferase involved in cell wall biosynthesis
MRTALHTRSWVYHYHDPELIGMGFVLRWVLGKKVIFDIHECVWRQLLSKPYLSTWMGRPLGWVYRFLERGLTIGQVKVVANAYSEGDYPNAILVQNFPLRSPEVVPAHRTFDFANPPQLVYLGHLSAIRGAYAYVELAHRLKLRERSFRMVLMGEHTESLYRELNDKIRTLGLESQVEVTGRVSWMEAMRVVSESTIGLCLLQPVPNYTTCLATKIMEYMMVGTPVLASRFDGWRRFVEDEGVGLMVDPLDGQAVLQACERMLDDEESLVEMSRRGRQAIQEKYHWAREFKKLESCYQQLFL